MRLADFAADRRRPTRCRVCGLEQRQEIDEGLRDGIAPTAVVDWLRDEHSVQLTRAAVRHHRDSGHHREAAE